MKPRTPFEIWTDLPDDISHPDHDKMYVGVDEMIEEINFITVKAEEGMCDCVGCYPLNGLKEALMILKESDEN